MNKIKQVFPTLGGMGLITSALLAACGGGSSGTTPQTFTAIDGLIKGAIVCIDANQNGLCDTGETQGTTDVLGAVTLNIPSADVGKYPVLAVVPVGAIDADDPANPITTGYILKAPADNPTVITPLTTLVQHQVENGLTSAQAASFVQEQTGVTNAFANFIATPDANARVVAKTIVQITQAKLADATLTAVVGTNDPITGKAITQADLNAAIRAAVVQTLPTIIATVSVQSQTGGACVDPTAAACKTAIAAQVSGASGLAAGTGVTATNLGALVGAGKSNATQTTETPVAGATLRGLNFTDASTWSYRANVSNLAESTPDANNLRRYRDLRAENKAGVVTNSGGLINEGRTNDIHWNGTAWVAACDSSWQNTSTARDTNGVAGYNYCDGFSKGRATAIKVDYSGKTIKEMVDAIRAHPSLTGWGASDGRAATTLSTLFSSTATLPSGSALYYYTTTPTDYGISYLVAGLPLFSEAVSAGGTSSATPAPACAPATGNPTSTVATSLATVIAQNQGTPCIYSYVWTPTGAGGVALTSGSRNEWWDQSTLNIGRIGSAAIIGFQNATSFYSGNTVIRVGFPSGAGNAATFYACQQDMQFGSSRNCTAIGTGAYTITTLGDAKVLAFTGVPVQAAPLTYARFFVERAGKVHYGYASKPNQSSDVRPNLTATNVLFNVLGIPVITP